MVFELLTNKLQEVVKKRGFKEPTLVQKLGIPPIISGKNVLLIAPTGVGKTESAMLPIFDEWIKKKSKPISILYITPLKSLNRDMLKRLLWWGNELDMDISVRHGDTSAYARKMQAEVPPDCLITTPETLQAILPAKKMKEHLKNVKFVVVDEVHELASSKRGTQLTIALERLRELCGDFQIISLSATIGSPEKVVNFISGGRPMEIVKAIETKQIKIQVINPKPIPSDINLAETVFTNRLTAARLRTVYDLIKNHTSTLTFTNTRDFAEILTSRLKQAYPSFPVENHHSSLSKEVRIRAENDFKDQKLKSIVCTSSLELGIDIGSIDFVIQYMSPRQTSKVIQRIGRSGHELKRISDGVIISTDIDDTFESAVIARQGMSEHLEPMSIHENALDVLAHQIVGITRDKYRITLDEVYKIVKRAYPFKDLTKEQFMSVCRQLNNLSFIFMNEDDTIKTSRKGLLYYFENLSTIPDTRSYFVINTMSNEKVGSLDEEFVAMHGQEGVTFIIKGEPWQIVTIDGRRIFVEPSGDVDAAIPGWEGDLMPVPFEVAQEVGSLRRLIADMLLEKVNKDEVLEEVKRKYPIDDSSAKKIIGTILKQLKYGVIPTDKKVLIEKQDDVLIIHTCLGTKGNETLGRMLSTILAAKIGSVGLKTDPYRIILHLQIMDTDLIEDALFKTKPEEFESLLELNLSNSRLFQWRFIHVAKRFGVIRKDADYGQSWLSRIIDLYQKTPVWEETLREIKTDKLDVTTVKDFLEKIQKKEINVIFKEGLSPIGKLGIKKRAELIGPEKAELQVLDIFENRLNDKKVLLVCMNCGDWTRTFRVKDLPEEIRCGKCKAKLIAATRPSWTQAQHIIKKKIKGSSLTTEEMRRFDGLEKISDLVIVYGKRAVKALAVRGIGPKTAARILRGMYDTEKDFVKTLLNAERQFIRTKRFWG
ncbi:MAG: DEAD/DEAH box helicase [Candidatus Aenigmarchaeota archaeon]|nr:DEAD/DEAH box helicase [Candidatus Aenigmarchaeota archaeon]